MNHRKDEDMDTYPDNLDPELQEHGMAPRYRCPTNPMPYDDNPDEYMAGCGCVFEAEPDFENLVTCPECGMWFNPKKEKRYKRIEGSIEEEFDRLAIERMGS